MSNAKISIRFFDDREVRAVWDEQNAKWWFSVLDIVAVLTNQDDYTKTRNYWKYLKAKLKKENSELVSATTQLKFLVPDGKKVSTQRKMKSILIILSTIILSCHLHAQEKKINDSSMQENWNIAFDKEKLEMLYPGSDFKESPLAGIWVEIDGKTDTLIFYPYFDGKEPIVNLKRGLNTDNKLPRQYSGPYHYRLEKGVIKTQWFLSSTISYPSCFFQMAADSSQLKIGNFYRPSDQIEDTLVFRRIDN